MLSSSCRPGRAREESRLGLRPVEHERPHVAECPELWELIAFFSQEPEVADDDVAWPYNEASWHIERNGQVLSVRVVGSSGDMRVTLGSTSDDTVALSLHRIQQLSIIIEPGGQTLQASFGEAASAQPLRLRVDPSIRIWWGLVET